MKSAILTKEYNKAIKEMTLKLTLEGKRLIVKAYNEADYRKDKTQNLHDSYGSAVYYNGKLQPNSKRYVGREAVVGKRDLDGNLILGRAELDEFLDSYRAKPRGFELVVVATIFYAGILEEGKQSPNGNKYIVISSIADDMDRLAHKVKGRVTQIGNF